MIVRRRSGMILSEIYLVRLEVVEMLTAAVDTHGGDVHGLRRVAGELDGVSSRCGDTHVGMTYASLAEMLRIAAMLVEWRQGVFDAQPEVERFKRGALARLTRWHSEYGERFEAKDIAMVVRCVSEDLTIDDVSSICHSLARVPLPIGITGAAERGPSFPRGGLQKEQNEDQPLPELSVAFLSFTVDAAPADQIHFLTPHETHDLEIEVRVSRWPDGVAELKLSPVSIEASSTYNFPCFTFPRPIGDPPFKLLQRGRAIINAAQFLRAQPFEFRYAAEFWPKETEQPVSVVGHRNLRIESIDIHKTPITGYPSVDNRLVDIRNQLRRLQSMPIGDLEHAMTLVVPLASFAARAIQDNLFPNQIGEAEFQKLIRDELRRCPQIGAALDEHPHAGGGVTDLSLFGVRLELKVVPTSRMELADCQQFVEQAAAYAVGSGKRIALLCVLDVTHKTQAPFPAEDGIGVLRAESGIPVVTVLIQGAMPKPSDLSRSGSRHRRA